MSDPDTADIIARLDRQQKQLDIIAAALRAIGAKPAAGKLLDLAEAAEYLGYSVHHLRRLAVEQGAIPCKQAGKGAKISFRRDDLDAYGLRPANVIRRVGRSRSTVTAGDVR